MFQKLIISSTVLTVCLLSIFLIRCANQLPPTGGDVDRIPPEIEEVYPPNGTTNYDEDYFEIEFSEYVDKRSVQDAIFISPYIDGALDFDWTSTTVEVTFPNELRKNITYTVTIGTD
ncbi:MAG: Ig-like domain-containing protein, partial [Ignavibacteriaceae bacterium]|nr:Ig-like domain-containing protein [Ignavibacteriaceae bacterium]